MKILILNYEFPPLGGGAGNATYYLLKQFAGQSGIAIDLVTSSSGSFRIDHFAENIKVHYLDIGKNENSLHYQTGKDILTYTFKAFRYARKLKKEKRYSLCHAFFGIPCGFIAMFLSLPYMVSLRGSDVPFCNSRFHWPDKLIFRRLSRLIWKKAKYVVANSEGLKDLALKTAPELDIKVIYNGVDTEQFYKEKKKVAGDKLKLISTGRLIERKGYRYLIEALEGKKKVELTLIGEGNLKGYLEDLAEENGIDVYFPGRVEHEDLKTLFK